MPLARPFLVTADVPNGQFLLIAKQNPHGTSRGRYLPSCEATWVESMQAPETWNVDFHLPLCFSYHTRPTVARKKRLETSIHIAVDGLKLRDIWRLESRPGDICSRRAPDDNRAYESLEFDADPVTVISCMHFFTFPHAPQVHNLYQEINTPFDAGHRRTVDRKGA